MPWYEPRDSPPAPSHPHYYPNNDHYDHYDSNNSSRVDDQHLNRRIESFLYPEVEAAAQQQQPFVSYRQRQVEADRAFWNNNRGGEQEASSDGCNERAGSTHYEQYHSAEAGRRGHNFFSPVDLVSDALQDCGQSQHVPAATSGHMNPSSFHEGAMDGNHLQRSQPTTEMIDGNIARGMRHDGNVHSSSRGDHGDHECHQQNQSFSSIHMSGRTSSSQPVNYFASDRTDDPRSNSSQQPYQEREEDFLASLRSRPTQYHQQTLDGGCGRDRDRDPSGERIMELSSSSSLHQFSARSTLGLTQTQQGSRDRSWDDVGRGIGEVQHHQHGGNATSQSQHGGGTSNAPTKARKRAKHNKENNDQGTLDRHFGLTPTKNHENIAANGGGREEESGGEGGLGRTKKKKRSKKKVLPPDPDDKATTTRPVPVVPGQRTRRRSKKRPRPAVGQSQERLSSSSAEAPTVVLTEETFAGLEDPKVGINNAAHSDDALREFLASVREHRLTTAPNLSDDGTLPRKGYICWTLLFCDHGMTTPFSPASRRYCTEKGPRCTTWHCTCDTQVRALQARSPLFGAMFVLPSCRWGGPDDEAEREQPVCFILPLGPTFDEYGDPETLPDSYSRMASWPVIPFACQVPLARRWEAFRTVLVTLGNGSGMKCVTFNPVVSLMAWHYHQIRDVGRESVDLIMPSVWDVRLASWMLRPHATDEALEFEALTSGFPHLRPDDGDGSVPHHATDQVRSMVRAKNQLLFLSNLYPVLRQSIARKGLEEALDHFEGPLQSVLAAMEGGGIGLKPHRLSRQQRRLERRLEELSAEARKIAGNDSFLLSSPQQVSHLLYDVLGITVPPSAVGGNSNQVSSSLQSGNRSTSEAVLETIQAASNPPHRIIEILLQFRSLNKLLTTYIRPLPTFARADEGGGSVAEGVGSQQGKENGKDIIARIHPMWMQTAVRTGRLSCRKPNMQQVPKDGAFGVRPRDAFCPTAHGMCLFACDYSQNEVRILAHMCQDEVLIKMFGQERTVDIYKQMSSAVTGKDVGNVTDEERRVAKQVVLAILYGMGVQQVAKKLKLDRNAAQRVFTSFFHRFRRMKQWMDGTKESARRDGYVTTIAGRRRYLDDIHSSDSAKRAQAERQAVNSVIQGSAADLMKLAMLKMAARIMDWNKEGVNAGGTGTAPRLMLQIHDELLFECQANEDDVNRLKDAVLRCCTVECERDLKLKVPLKLTCSVGTSWGSSMKDLI